MLQKINKFILLIIVIIIIVFSIYFYQSYFLSFFFEKHNLLIKTQSVMKLITKTESNLDLIKTRDFMSYSCKNMTRIGGQSHLKKNAPHSLFRIDGAWFVCLDDQLTPARFNCNVLSFGISSDYTFDMEMNKDYGCNVFSFDPFYEADIFAKIRAANKDLLHSINIKVNSKWNFYKYTIFFHNIIHFRLLIFIIYKTWFIRKNI